MCWRPWSGHYVASAAWCIHALLHIQHTYTIDKRLSTRRMQGIVGRAWVSSAATCIQCKRVYSAIPTHPLLRDCVHRWGIMFVHICTRSITTQCLCLDHQHSGKSSEAMWAWNSFNFSIFFQIECCWARTEQPLVFYDLLCHVAA